VTEELLEAGVDPDHTPVDRLPDYAAWALVSYFHELNGESLE
jgi:hypothetical protein